MNQEVLPILVCQTGDYFYFERFITILEIINVTSIYYNHFYFDTINFVDLIIIV